MIIRNATKYDLSRALAMTNAKYGNNVAWNRFTKEGDIFIVTLKVKDSKKAGHSLGLLISEKTGKRRLLSSACWHVHGTFLEALITLNQNITILTAEKVVNKDGGNWEDWNAGSVACPVLASERCNCN